ncbi:DNA cytosine methyltransferase [Patescibacteria group bacterium]
MVKKSKNQLFLFAPSDEFSVEESSYYWKGYPLVKKRDIKKNGKLKVVELFCGCGGTSKGFEMAGFDIILGADIHVPSAETFHYNHKNSLTLLGDLQKVSSTEFKDMLSSKKVDVMIAGVPCQGFSLNNRKRNAADKRNFLFKEYMKFVKNVQPPVAILENVSGMRSMANGTFVQEIEVAFKKIGYENVQHKILNAADFGVPQVRMRLVFVATRKGIDFAWPKETHGQKGKKPYVTVKEAIGDLPKLNSGETSDSYDGASINEYQNFMRKRATKTTSRTGQQITKLQHFSRPRKFF